MTDPPELLTTGDGKQTLPGQGLGFPCAVQHPAAMNIVAEGPGKVVVSPVVAPQGSAIMVQIQHEDGTSLAFFLDEVQLHSLQYALLMAAAKLREIRAGMAGPKT